jgi:hypothetical protein
MPPGRASRFCLSRIALKQKQRCGLLIPTQHQAVGVASKPVFPKQKPPCGGFYFEKWSVSAK